MKDPCKTCDDNVQAKGVFCDEQAPCQACARRAMRERDRYKAVHESELGVCQKHCDVVRDLKRQVAKLEGLILRAHGRAAGVRSIWDARDEVKINAEAARIAKRRAGRAI